MRVSPVNIVGGFNDDDAASWARLDPVNWIPEIAEGQNRSQAKLANAPGLNPRVDLGAGPIRGLHNVQGKLFAVSGNTLFEVRTDNTFVSRGTIPGVARVGMAHNQRDKTAVGNELIVTNDSSGYVWDTAASTFGRITDPGYPGGHSPVFVDGYLAQVEPFGRFWFHSELTEATQYNTLDQYQSESSPDRIVTLGVNQSEVIVFNETTTEFFYNSGATTGTFKSKRITTDRGCASRHGAVKLDNSQLWLGNDGVFYRLNGYSAQPISTGPVEKAVAGYDWAGCFAFTYESKHHKIAYWTFPNGKTFGYDVVTGLWHRRKSFGLERWRVNALVEWNGEWIAGDYASGQLYTLDWAAAFEGDDPLERELTSPIMHDELNPFSVNRLHLLFDVRESVAMPTSGTELTPVVLWGANSDASGIAIDADMSFNSEVADSVSVGVVGLYSGGAPFSYPPAADPVSVDLSGRTLTTITPIALTIGNVGPGISFWWAPAVETTAIPFGAHYVRISYHSGGPPTFVVGLIYNSPGA